MIESERRRIGWNCRRRITKRKKKLSFLNLINRVQEVGSRIEKTSEKDESKEWRRGANEGRKKKKRTGVERSKVKNAKDGKKKGKEGMQWR